MIRMAVRETDDFQTSRLGVLLDAQLLEGIQLVSVPRPVGDGIAHAAEFVDLVIGTVDPADQRAAGLVRVTGLEMLAHLVHHRVRNAERQNFRR